MRQVFTIILESNTTKEDIEDNNLSEEEYVEECVNYMRNLIEPNISSRIESIDLQIYFENKIRAIELNGEITKLRKLGYSLDESIDIFRLINFEDAFTSMISPNDRYNYIFKAMKLYKENKERNK